MERGWVNPFAASAHTRGNQSSKAGQWMARCGAETESLDGTARCWPSCPRQALPLKLCARAAFCIIQETISYVFPGLVWRWSTSPPLVVMAFKQVISSQLRKQDVCRSRMDLLLPRREPGRGSAFYRHCKYPGKRTVNTGWYLRCYFGPCST